jgi:hypothetical protein
MVCQSSAVNSAVDQLTEICHATGPRNVFRIVRRCYFTVAQFCPTSANVTRHGDGQHAFFRLQDNSWLVSASRHIESTPRKPVRPNRIATRAG